jgi:chaperone BCS1
MEDLVELMRSTERKCICLFEDIDAIDAARSRTEKKNDFQLKTNDLLNCIDGIIATEGRIIIFTTNHIDKLDPALIRSGRIDRRFYITYPEKAELQKFYDNAKKYIEVPEINSFYEKLPNPCTIADAQTVIFKKDI